MNILARWLLCLFLVACLPSATGNATAFLSAPHDQEHGLTCRSCHQYPFDSWPGYVQDSGNIDDTFPNYLCLSCHDGNSAPPRMLPHSANSIGGRLTGWTTQCIDCHDPHFQKQLQHAAGDADRLFLVTGDILNVAIDNSDPQNVTSIISYGNATALTGRGDPSLWNAKTDPGRGLIFVADKNQPSETYEILAADATTITVAGNAWAAGVGHRFGIIYGQMIRDLVTLPGGGKAQVRFFRPETDFTDVVNPVARGLCQVCHTATLHWTADGGNTTHNAGVACTGCHRATDGFKSVVYTHTGLAVTASCDQCHGPGSDVVAGIHKGNCAACHQSASPVVMNVIVSGGGDCLACHGQYFYSHLNAQASHVPSLVTGSGTSCGVGNCHWGSALILNIDPRYHQACASCHDSNGGLVGSASGRAGMAPNTCLDCHAAGFVPTHTPVPAHTTLITSTGTSCARCHDPQNTTNHLTATHKNDCAACHDSQGALIGVAAGGRGNCTFCHGTTYFYWHRTMDHTPLLSSINSNIVPPQPTTCASCHDPALAADVLQDIHRGQCSLCHDDQGYLVAGPSGSAMGGAGSCFTCHGAGYFWSHRVRDHEQLYNGGNSCISCHFPADTPADIVGGVHNNNCGLCHHLTGGGVLIGSAAGKLNGSDCMTCHGNHHGSNPPVAVDDAFPVQEDTADNVLDVLVNDSDPDPGDTISVLSVGPGSAGGTVTSTATNVLYTPAPNFHGTEIFTYTIQDSTGNTAQATVTVTVSNVNDAPVAVDDTATTAEDTPVTTASVLANDTDIDGDTLSVSAADAVSVGGGTVVNNLDGTFTYTPAADYNGGDSFTYTVADGNGGSATGTVTITVTPVNDAPVAVADTATTAEDTPVTTASVLANDTDIDGDTLSVSAADAVSVNGGTVVNNLDGTFTYTPALNYNGTDSFAYTVSDGNGGSATGTVTVTVTPVNDAPVAVDDTATTAEDTPVTTASVLVNDTDIDGDTLSVSAADTVSVSGGPVVNNLDGTFTYTPALNYNGTDSFAYTVSDGNGGSATGTVTITVTPVNDAPVAVADTATTAEDTPVTTASVLVNDTDIDGDTLSVSAADTVSVGGGTVVNNLDGTFTYTPAMNFNGDDSFTYTVADGNGGSATGTVTVTVTPVNDPPVAVADSAATNEDVAVVTVNVLANDTDVDGDTLSVSTADAVSVGGGTVVNNLNGTFTYTPALNFNGGDSFTYTVADGNGGSATGTVTITVTPVNDLPLTGADSYATGQGQTLSVAAPGVLTNDSDADGDSLTVDTAPVSAPTHGILSLGADGSFSYTHDGSATTSDAFTYQVSDGNGGTAQGVVTISITSNASPTAVADSYTVAEDGVLTVAAGTGVLINDTDPESDPLTAALVATTSNGILALNTDGSLTYTPNANYNGTDSFTYTAADQYHTSNVATVTITVTPVNDAPVAVADTATTAEDTPVTTASVLVNDTDIDGDTLSVSAADAVSVNGGTVVNNLDGTFTYTPALNYNGTDSFAYTVADGNGGSATGTVTVTVTPVNDAPVAVADSYSAGQGQTLTVAAVSGVLANDTDIEGDILTVNAIPVAAPANGSLTLNADGGFSYTHDGSATSSDSFTYQVADGNGGTAQGVVTITITANAAPMAVADSYAVAEDGVLNVTAVSGVLANDIDPESDPLTAAVVATTTHGTLNLVADGSFTYTPNANYHGTDSFSYQAADPFNSSNLATVTITVTPVNDAPVAVNDSVVTAEDTPVTTVNVLLNDTDADGDLLSVSGADAVSANGGTVVNNLDGTFTYTPTANFNGGDTFTYTVADGNGGSATGTVTITVTPVNDAPVAVADTAATSEDTSVTTGNVLQNDTDVDGDTLSIAGADAVSVGGGTVVNNLDGTFTYTPALNFNGGDSFTYTVADGNGGSATGTVTITVTPVNDAPLTGADGYATGQGQTLNVVAPGVLANDTDADGDSLTVNTVPVSVPTHGSLTLYADGSFSYTHDGSATTSDAFTYQVSDGNGGTAQGVVTISITSNASPTAVADSYTVAEDGVLTVAAGTGVLINDTDPESDPLTAALVATTSNGILALNTDGSLTYTPNANYNGTDSFTYTAADQYHTSNVATVTITVTPVNDAPVAVADTATTAEDTPVTTASVL
ncbi:MAG: Ig-like domain-containing protein, partial [Thermodesulfobacteriota bacterium]